MSRINILLADENEEIRNTIFSNLENRFNFLLLMPHSFDELFKAPYLDSFLAIIDHSFSGNRGLTVMKKVKIHRPALPVIFTTHQSTKELYSSAFKLGARDYFGKPYMVKNIIKNIEIILATKKWNIEDRENVLLNNYTKSFCMLKSTENDHIRIEKAKSFMEDNFSKTLSHDLLSRIACISKAHFGKIFKKETGMTYSEYYNQLRIKKARSFLKNDKLTITETCFLAGFNDLSCFKKTFENIEGLSPSAYKKQYLFKKKPT